MPKAKISVSLDVDLILWVDDQVEKGVFKSRSEAIQRCMKQKMKEEQGRGSSGYLGV